MSIRLERPEDARRVRQVNELAFGQPLEADLVDTLRRVTAWRQHAFVWLIGADNLAQLPRWRHWRQVLAACPVAVFERHPYSYRALAGPAATAFAGRRLEERDAPALAGCPPPAWVFMRLRPHPASATISRR